MLDLAVPPASIHNPKRNGIIKVEYQGAKLKHSVRWIRMATISVSFRLRGCAADRYSLYPTSACVLWKGMSVIVHRLDQVVIESHHLGLACLVHGLGPEGLTAGQAQHYQWSNQRTRKRRLRSQRRGYSGCLAFQISDSWVDPYYNGDHCHRLQLINACKSVIDAIHNCKPIYKSMDVKYG